MRSQYSNRLAQATTGIARLLPLPSFTIDSTLRDQVPIPPAVLVAFTSHLLINVGNDSPPVLNGKTSAKYSSKGDTDNMVEMGQNEVLMRYTKWRTQPTIDQKASISNTKQLSISMHDASHTEHGEAHTRKDLRDAVLAYLTLAPTVPIDYLSSSACFFNSNLQFVLPPHLHTLSGSCIRIHSVALSPCSILLNELLHAKNALLLDPHVLLHFSDQCAYLVL